MEAVIFIGIQGAGKSTFYKERFFHTHLRINLDMLKTKRREDLLLRACLEAGQPFAVDNTNVTRERRARYISAAKAAGFRVVGYYFKVEVRDALQRNSLRSGGQFVPVKGVYGTYKKLQAPDHAEGFDRLYTVTPLAGQQFTVEEFAAPGVPDGEQNPDASR